MPVKIVNNNNEKSRLVPFAAESTNESSASSMEFALASVRGSQLVLSANALNAVVADFALSYYAGAVGTSFVSHVSINWNLFKNNILTGIAASDFERVAVRFIHRYQPSAMRWFLCAEVLLLKPNKSYTTADGLYNVYEIDTVGNRYDINNGNMTVSTLPANEHHDQEYFTNVIDSNGALDPQVHVKSIIIPWQRELLKMYQDNALDNTANDVLLKFVSCTMDCSDDLDQSYIAWPHGIAVYLTQQGTEHVDNNNYAVIFRNKAADFGSMCPPRCDAYYRPFDL